MKEYVVEMTASAQSAIYDHAHYIAIERQEPLSAVRWLERTLDAVRTLKTMPKRCALAEENGDVDYEVRQLLVGSPFLLLTIDDDRQTVWVFAFRGQGQPSQADSLPRHLGSIRQEQNDANEHSG
ncbi:MAG: plasmid stabilization system protein ParE [Planctomycetota bacterium]|jgi:plasmid stabilization system protein ParE